MLPFRQEHCMPLYVECSWTFSFKYRFENKTIPNWAFTLLPLSWFHGSLMKLLIRKGWLCVVARMAVAKLAASRARLGVFPTRWPWTCYPNPLGLTFFISENGNGASFTGWLWRLDEITEVRHLNCLRNKFSQVAAHEINMQEQPTFPRTNNERSKK